MPPTLPKKKLPISILLIEYAHNLVVPNYLEVVTKQAPGSVAIAMAWPIV